MRSQRTWECRGGLEGEEEVEKVVRDKEKETMS